MERRKFIQWGTLLAASATQLPVYGRGTFTKREGSGFHVDFIYDGIQLSPVEYADLLMKLVDEGKIRTDNYSRGGVVEELENKFSSLLGKESAVFMPTGTLANHIAVRKLAGTRRRVIVQEQSHLYNDSGDCTETLSGLNLITAGPDAVHFSLDEVKAIAGKTATGRVETAIGVISIETPVRRKHDQMVDYEEMRSISDYAKENGIKMHLDGARLFVQSAHTNISPARYSELFDTVYTSMYKCFNAPAGAILAGTKQFTEHLFHERRMFGGGIPSAWPFAAIALYYADRFLDDYKAAWTQALRFIALITKDERYRVSFPDKGTHIIRLELKNGQPSRLATLLAKENIHLPGPSDKGFYLKINPTINRVSAEELAGLFMKAMEGAG